ncbi:MAG: FxsA family protein [Halofilum sp. (in: g-proteobacteria)]|nr:FxsA family protein [Halofilum sp. (in: g-proteobacteria)]
MPLLLLFLLVPLVEIWILIEVGQEIGALPTIGLCVLTAVVGAALLRLQGLRTLTRAQENLNRGEIPAIEMFEGVALAFGGALLLTPGFATDVLGFLCLVPWSRRAMIRGALRRMNVYYGPPGGPGAGPGRSQHTIEGDFRRDDRD